MAKPTAATLKKADQSARSASTFIGELVWWNLSDVAPTRELLHRALVESGVSSEQADKFMPSPLTPSAAFSRAVAQIKTTLASRKEVEGDTVGSFSVHHAWSDNEVNIYVIGKAKFRPSTREALSSVPQQLIFDKVGETVKTSSNLLKDEFLTEYQRALTHYTHNHIREIILTIVNLYDGISVRESGGIYFVPREVHDPNSLNGVLATDKILDFVKKFVEHPYVGNSSFFRMAVADVENSCTSMAKVVEQAAAENIDQFRKDIDAALNGKGRPSTLAKRLDDLIALRDRTRIFSTLLRAEFKQINSSIDTIEAEILQTLNTGTSSAASSEEA